MGSDHPFFGPVSSRPYGVCKEETKKKSISTSPFLLIVQGQQKHSKPTTPSGHDGFSSQLIGSPGQADIPPIQVFDIFSRHGILVFKGLYMMHDTMTSPFYSFVSLFLAAIREEREELSPYSVLYI